jgi:hypothetical protein
MEEGCSAAVETNDKKRRSLLLIISDALPPYDLFK